MKPGQVILFTLATVAVIELASTVGYILYTSTDRISYYVGLRAGFNDVEGYCKQMGAK